MQFTGTNLTLKRSIFPQTGNYAFDMNCFVDNTTGKYFFGLSGNGNKVEFEMQSGKIYFDNKFIHSYLSNQQFSISVELTDTKLNINKNDTALIYGGEKETGYFNYFYFNREAPDLGAAFSVSIGGDTIPNYNIQENGYLFSSGQGAVTGYFINNSEFPIRIFNSAIQTPQPYSFGRVSNYVEAFSSGSFSYSGDFNSINFSQPVLTTFNTNFGDSTVLFTITDLRSAAYLVYLQSITDFSVDSNNNLNRDISYLNYKNGDVSNAFETRLTFILDYISGSGTFTETGGLGYSTTGYGSFVKSGTLTGWATTETGNFPVSQFAWATGRVSKYISGIGTGMASGSGFTGVATGTMTGLFEDYIFDGSGTLSLNSSFVGLATSAAISFEPENTTYATGYLDLTTFYATNMLVYSPPTGITRDLAGRTGINLYAEKVDLEEEVVYTGYNDDTWAESTTQLFCQFAHGTGLAWFINEHPDMGLIATYDDIENIIRFQSSLAGTVGNNSLIWSNAEGDSPGSSARGANTNFIGGYNSRNYYATGFLNFENAANASSFVLVTPSGTGFNSPVSYGAGLPFHSALQFTKEAVRASTGLRVVAGQGNFWQLKYYGSGTAWSDINRTGMLQVAWALSGLVSGLTADPTNLGFNNKMGVVHQTPYTGGYYFPLRAAVPGSAGESISIGHYIGSGGGTGMSLNGGFGYFKMSGSNEFDGTPVIPYGEYTGGFNFSLTGSGNYNALITGQGEIFEKLFINSWSMSSGVNANALYSMPVFPNENQTRITGGGTFPPNTFINFQLNHINSGTNSDSARLTISGNLVYNPISGVLNIQNV